VQTGLAVQILATADHELALWAQGQGVPVTTAEPRVIDAICDTRTPQGVVAECRLPTVELAELLTGSGPVVVCEGLADPGNLGSIIRTAEAVGAAGVVTTHGSVDPWNPKAVRAAAGSSFRVPVVAGQQAGELIERLRAAGRVSIALTAQSETDAMGQIRELIREGHRVESIAWVVGSEAHGIAPEIAALADRRASVPMRAPVESLNAAVAISVCLYAAAWAEVPR